jgi:hypothetical protein
MKHTPGGPMHEHETSKGHIHEGGSHRKGGKDPHAHSSHHEHNKEHGMSDGFCPKDEECAGTYHQEGGRGMEHNAKHENDKTPKKAID